MPINGPVTQRMTLATKSSTLFSGTASATMTALHAIPTGGAFVRVEVGSGTSNNGTIVITGNVNGASISESVAFTTARWKISSNKFDAGNITIASSGLADEAVKPQVSLDASDAAGNKIEWESSKSFPCRMRTVKGFGLSYLMEVKQQGLVAQWMYECFVPGNPSEFVEGMEFTVGKMRGVFMISSQIQQHQQLGTDLVDFITFFATKRSN